MRTYRRFLDRFERRYQLIIRNIENFAEYVSTPFSYTTLIIIILSWFCASFGVSLWLAKTVLARWMNPTYIETENQKKVLTLASTVETLEQKLVSQTKFIDTLQKVIQGKSNPPLPDTTAPTIPEPIATIPEIQSLAPETEPLTTTPTKRKAPVQSIPRLCFPPIHGMITEPFNRKSGHYGVDIVAKEKDPIKAISTGIVIFSDWSVDTGWVIAIQHHNNMVSICKHCAILFKKVGNLVRAGDVVALMGNSGEISTGPHLHFELWSEGIALNPEDFINF